MLQGARACARGWACSVQCSVQCVQPTSSSLSRLNPHPPHPGALEVRRAQEGLRCVRPGGRRPGAAGPAVQEGGRGGAVPDLPRAAARAHDAAVRPRVLHGVRGRAAGEGRVDDVPALPIASSAGPGQAVRAGEPGVGEDQPGGGPKQDRLMASAFGVAAGRDGRRDGDAAGGDGSGERWAMVKHILYSRRSLASFATSLTHLAPGPR